MTEDMSGQASCGAVAALATTLCCTLARASSEAVNVPPLLRSDSGAWARTAAEWESVRRPELERWFLENVYGVRPAAAERPDVGFRDEEPPRPAMGGAAVLRRVRATYSGPFGEGSFVFSAFIPVSDRPSPALVFICNRDPGENIDPTRARKSPCWPAEEIVRRGYAAVAFFNGDLAEETYDAATALRSGVFAAYDAPGGRTPKSWGALSAWAWGASRVMDWIEGEGTIDAARVGVVGHSRAGKAALVAGATDRRFALVCSNCSGTGGARMMRVDLPDAEPWASFSHFGVGYWFAPSATDPGIVWGAHDQHQFLSLIAPRLLIVRSRRDDAWAGPDGEREAVRFARAAWDLYGAGDGVAHSVADGPHRLDETDWRVFMDFADWHWRRTTVNVRDAGAVGDGVRDDSAAIQNALDTPSRPLEVVVPAGRYLIGKGLKIGSRTRIRADGNARFVFDGSVRHRAGDFLLSNAGAGEGVRDRDITIVGGVWDGNTAQGFNVKEPKERKFVEDAWSGVTVAFRGVDGLHIRDVHFANSVTYNARFCDVTDFDIRGISISSSTIANNQDGLHFAGFCRHGRIDGVKVLTRGETNDDLIALNADDNTERHENRGTVNGPIEDIDIRNISADDCHCLIRLLRTDNPIRRIYMRDARAGCRYNAINCDDARKWIELGRGDGAPPGGAPLEDIVFERITIWPTARSGSPLILVEGATAGNGVVFRDIRGNPARASDPGRTAVQFRNLAPGTLHHIGGLAGAATSLRHEALPSSLAVWPDRAPGAPLPLSGAARAVFAGVADAVEAPRGAGEVALWCAAVGIPHGDAALSKWGAELEKALDRVADASPGARVALCEPFSWPQSRDVHLMRMQDRAAAVAARRGIPLAKMQRRVNGGAGPAAGGVFSWDVPSNPALVPRAKLEADCYDWYARHSAFLGFQRRSSPEIVFIGDSITHFWAGRDSFGGIDALPRWKSLFGVTNLNAGFGWDRIQNVLWRLDHGLMDGLRPRVVVLLIGTNNMGGTDHAPASSPGEIAEGVGAICARLREKAPEARIVLVNILPRGMPGEPWRTVAAQANILLKELSMTLGNAEFVDVYDQFLDGAGNIPPRLMPDRTHPSDDGYAILGGALPL